MTATETHPAPAAPPTPALYDDPRARAIIEKSPNLGRFVAELAGVESLPPELAALSIVARIAEAKTADEVGQRGDVDHARDWIGQPFALTGYRWLASDFAEGPQAYMVLDGVDDDGAPVVITCGALNVMVAAWRYADLGALPFSVVLSEADKPSKAGFRPMWLEAAEAPFDGPG